MSSTENSLLPTSFDTALEEEDILIGIPDWSGAV